jgi:Sensors of blue-light using FAD
MPLLHLVYCSRRTPCLTMDVLDSIISVSSKNNNALNITGVLYCCGNNLMQLLEGEPAAVTALYEKISADPRHSHVELLLSKTVNKRLFPEWGMGLLNPDCKEVITVQRLRRLVEEVRNNHDTALHTVETRLLLNDFRMQLDHAA